MSEVERLRAALTAIRDYWPDPLPTPQFGDAEAMLRLNREALAHLQSVAAEALRGAPPKPPEHEITKVVFLRGSSFLQGLT